MRIRLDCTCFKNEDNQQHQTKKITRQESFDKYIKPGTWPEVGALGGLGAILCRVIHISLVTHLTRNSCRKLGEFYQLLEF